MSRGQLVSDWRDAYTEVLTPLLGSNTADEVLATERDLPRAHPRPSRGGRRAPAAEAGTACFERQRKGWRANRVSRSVLGQRAVRGERVDSLRRGLVQRFGARLDAAEHFLKLCRVIRAEQDHSQISYRFATSHPAYMSGSDSLKLDDRDSLGVVVGKGGSTASKAFLDVCGHPGRLVDVDQNGERLLGETVFHGRA